MIHQAANMYIAIGKIDLLNNSMTTQILSSASNASSLGRSQVRQSTTQSQKLYFHIEIQTGTWQPKLPLAAQVNSTSFQQSLNQHYLCAILNYVKLHIIFTIMIQSEITSLFLQWQVQFIHPTPNLAFICSQIWPTNKTESS